MSSDRGLDCVGRNKLYFFSLNSLNFYQRFEGPRRVRKANGELVCRY